MVSVVTYILAKLSLGNRRLVISIAIETRQDIDIKNNYHAYSSAVSCIA